MRQGKPQPYRSFLLRCWQEGEASPGEEAEWRFSVEEVVDEPRRKGFSNLEAVCAFLRDQLMGTQSGDKTSERV
jgi:hypothetical protein